MADLHYYHSGNVLFVGEENFTLTVAFTAYRQSKKWSDTPWDGITSTRYKPESAEGYVGETLCKPAPILSEVKLQCIGSSRNDDVKTMKLINDLPSVPAGTWLYGVNPLALPVTLTQDQQVIWFLCPLIASYAPQQSTTKLVFNFLLSLAPQIQPGVHVCVGITEPSKLLKAIQDEHLAASDNSTPVLEFVGVDDQLSNNLLDFGYIHQSADCHKTLIFKRKNAYDALPTNCCTDHHNISRSKVLFVGDSALAVAFAAHQGTWDDITFTPYEPVGPEGKVQYVGKTLVQCKPIPTLSEVKLNCIASCVEDCLNTCDNLQTIKKCIIDLPDVPPGTWWYGIDPLALRSTLIQGHDFIWFHCPWTSAEESSLLLQFVHHLDQYIDPDVHVCISCVKSCACLSYFVEKFSSESTDLRSSIGNELVKLLFKCTPKITQDRVVLVLTNRGY